MNEERDMNSSYKKKKRRTIALSLLLVAALAVGITLAYLFSKTDPKENVFTFAENIKGVLDEPNWNPDEATELVPGKTIEKDPQITNTSNNAVTEYAAIKLTFQKGNGDTLTDAEMLTLMQYIDIEWSSNWTLKDGTMTTSGSTVTAATPELIYVFNDTLPQGVTSDPIFYSVTIKDSVTPAQLLWLAGDYGHEDSCYTFGTHDPSVCTVTYRHHEKCAIYGLTGAEDTAKGGTIGAKTCDCSATEIHESTCPTLIGTLKADCGHTTLVSGIGNFTIKVEGAVVQADSFDTLFNDASDALIDLFN